MPALHLIHAPTSANVCGMDGRGTTIRADVSCDRCRRIVRMERARRLGENPGEFPGQGPRPGDVRLGGGANGSAVPTLHAIPITDDRYAASRDGRIWTCAVRGTRERGEWHECRLGGNSAISVSLASGRRSHRTPRRLWEAAFPGETWPKAQIAYACDEPKSRTRVRVVHLSIAGRPACGAISLDAVVSSRADKTTCRSCKRSEDWLEVMG